MDRGGGGDGGGDAVRPPARDADGALRLSQHVVGLGITLLATAAAYFAYRLALPRVTTPPRIEAFQPLPVPYLADLPIIGPALFNQTPLTYLAFALVLVVSLVLYRTPLGLAVRAAGENPLRSRRRGCR
jgi:general nucleoside transport system permease protein